MNVSYINGVSLFLFFYCILLKDRKEVEIICLQLVGGLELDWVVRHTHTHAHTHIYISWSQKNQKDEEWMGCSNSSSN